MSPLWKTKNIFMIWNMLRLFLQVLTLLANLQMGKREIWQLNRTTHPCSVATATWYHVFSCGCIKMSVFCILPRSTGMSTFVLDVRASGWAFECSTFSPSEQEQSVSQTRGDLPEQVMKWFLWGGHCLRGAQMVCVLSREPPTLTPPVLLQHSLSGHLDGVCELFES